jgi:hypothetical protein
MPDGDPSTTDELKPPKLRRRFVKILQLGQFLAVAALVIPPFLEGFKSRA